MLVYLGVLPKDKDQPGKMSKTEATEVFKRAKVEIKSFKDPREMDAAECTAALRMVAGACGLGEVQRGAESVLLGGVFDVCRCRCL